MIISNSTYLYMSLSLPLIRSYLLWRHPVHNSDNKLPCYNNPHCTLHIPAFYYHIRRLFQKVYFLEQISRALDVFLAFFANTSYFFPLQHHISEKMSKFVMHCSPFSTFTSQTVCSKKDFFHINYKTRVSTYQKQVIIFQKSAGHADGFSNPLTLMILSY